MIQNGKKKKKKTKPPLDLRVLCSSYDLTARRNLCHYRETGFQNGPEEGENKVRLAHNRTEIRLRRRVRHQYLDNEQMAQLGCPSDRETNARGQGGQPCNFDGEK